MLVVPLGLRVKEMDVVSVASQVQNKFAKMPLRSDGALHDSAMPL